MARSLMLVGALILAAPLHAAEKWADAKMPISQPLLWLDATHQKAAYVAHGKTLTAGSLVDAWYDASGQKNDVLQRVQAMQPRYSEVNGVGFMRFAGKEFLGRIRSAEPLDDFTLILVAIPRSSEANFHGWFSTSALGKNDYQTGINLDQPPPIKASLKLNPNEVAQINVEGGGFSGMVNLLRKPLPLGQLRTLRVEGSREAIKLFVDDQFQGERKRGPGRVSLDTLTVGARYYSNGGDPPFIQGLFHGDISEVLFFGRLLKSDEFTALQDYLRKRYAPLAKELAAGKDPFGHLLKTVANPPPVQVLVPGFSVRELPVQLPNLNNVRYRADGKLVALGYNGNIYLLSDKDGDGIEETAHVFWENKTGIRGPIGMALTPPNYPLGQGVFVPNKGKLSLIVDTDGDDKADKEIVVAEGWKEIAQAVDAIGIALDKDNNIYFGLGTANFANAYLKDKDGKAHYDIKSDRGTIQQVSADFKKRETYCTGVRFTVALAFNKHGDLFCTDQEGATWLPNGNPFDELLHLQPGRHYGFPPRHPKHLPDVIDEPSVFDYGPQHQSTCGMVFNESVNGGPTFGPKNWEGDAIVCGESRGKLYRTKLVKTPSGYVAQNHLFACLQMLTIDACVSPRGDLIVCCHSGPPDWGTGPQGQGKIFRISYTDKEAPQPLFAYPAGPREVRIPFDRPLDPESLKNLTKQVKIEYGKYVRPGDRFETLVPPYAVVKAQLATPRFQLPVYSAQITSDRRTLVLTTGPHVEAVSYAVTVPATQTRGEIDLGYDLTGIQAECATDGGEKWSGWLPHLDLQVCRIFAADSAEHFTLWKLTQSPGLLKIKTNLDLANMLRPALQPGTSIDYQWPVEEVFYQMRGGMLLPVVPEGGNILLPTTPIPPGTDFPSDWGVKYPKRIGDFRVAFSTNEDKRPRAFPLHRQLVPWASRKSSSDSQLFADAHPALKGANWSRGKEIFFGELAQCSKCHQVRGEGGLQGPDLSNLVHRDYESVLRDIKTPSAALNPDYLTYVVNLKDGRAFTGTLRSDGDKLWIGTNEGKETATTRSNIESLQPSALSTMPEGLEKKLSAGELRDLMKFLLTEPAIATKGTEQAQLKDFTNTDLGIKPIEAKKDSKTGFIVGGKNATSVVESLNELNGRTFAVLEKQMRPGAPGAEGSTAGFLGRDESLLELLVNDNRYVVDDLALSHQELARHLHILAAIGAKHSNQEFLYHGRRFKVTGMDIATAGNQYSPFGDGTKANQEARVANLDNGEKIAYSLLVPQMIERYGFYEGRGTPYRVDPRQIMAVLDFLKPGPGARIKPPPPDAEVKERAKKLDQTSTAKERMAALYWLNDHRDAANAHLALPMLEECIRREPEERLRESAVAVLGLIAKAQQLPCPLIIIEAMLDKSEYVSQTASGMAYQFNSFPPGSVELMLRCLDSENANLRESCLSPLARAGKKDKRVIEALEKATRDKTFGMRHNAQVALFQATDNFENFLAYLIRLQEDPTGVLGPVDTNSEEGKRELTRMNIAALGSAMLVIGWSDERADDLAAALVKLLASPTPTIRRGAARLAGACAVKVDLTQRQGTVDLKTLLEPDKSAKPQPSNAATSLAKLQIENHLRRLRDTDPDDSVRNSARIALERFASVHKRRD